jgi:hypothetical protein
MIDLERLEFSRADFLERFFCHRRDDFALQTVDGRYSRQGAELKYSDLLRHVTGEQTVGVYQTVYPQETCTWIMYDIDDHGERGHKTTEPREFDNSFSERSPKTAEPQDINSSQIDKLTLQGTFENAGIPYYTECSGSENSYHIWIFLSEPTPLAIAYNWARAMIMWGTGYIFDGEVFPKQAALNREKPFGNLAKLPLGINRKSMKWSTFERFVTNPETVDITGWVPVSLPKPKKTETELSGILEPAERNVLSISGVRPCIQAMIRHEVQLGSYHGHKLRIAVASELHNAGHSTREIVNVFKKQSDFDYETSLYQVESVKGYNKPKCSTLKAHCNAMKRVTGFDIEKICENCLMGG